MFKNKKIHLIGIGGVSMSGIAYMLIAQGSFISGSDQSKSEITDKLVKENIDITIGSNKNKIKGTDIVVYSAAIAENDPELVEAKKLNIKTYERAEFLGILSKNYEHCLCITGTHGKSTTTGMLSYIFLEANLNPTISIGAKLPIINSNILIGEKKYLIMEACEYVDSFLHFYPTSALITNIDNDHLDYFKNLDNIKKSFEKFSELIPSNGFLAINNDDFNSKDLIKSKTNIITYGINNESQVMAKNIKFNEFGYPSYDLYIKDVFITKIQLSVSGTHNIYNSLAAISISTNYIEDITIIKEGLFKYHGVGRRFELLGTYNNALLYDDYAHHPTEIKTTYEATTKTKHNKSYAVFQGHTYTRVKEHMEDFASILSKFDEIIVAPIYAAREKNIYNVKEDDLVKLIKNENENVIHLDTLEKITLYLKEHINQDDIVITIGAGDINKVIKNIIKDEN